MRKESNINRYYEHGPKAPKTNNHIVICVPLTDRKSYYIDLTGAQFGLHGAVALARNYRNAHVKETAAIKSLGNCKHEVEDTLSNPYFSSFFLGGQEDLRLEFLGRDAAARMYAEIHSFVQSTGRMTLKDVLRAKKDDFESI
jgi:hypothetical protein